MYFKKPTFLVGACPPEKSGFSQATPENVIPPFLVFTICLCGQVQLLVIWALTAIYGVYKTSLSHNNQYISEENPTVQKNYKKTRKLHMGMTMRSDISMISLITHQVLMMRTHILKVRIHYLDIPKD